MNDDPVYRRDGDLWIPSPLARGPFNGQHGGGVGAIMAASMEDRARADGFGEGAQLTLYLLRRVPLEPMTVSVREQRIGRRLAVYAAELSHDGTIYATATAAFLSPLAMPDVPPVATEPRMPAGAPFGGTKGFSEEPWFGDMFEIKKDATGCVWMRPERPVVAPRGALSFTAAAADWTSGMTRPDWFGSNSVAGFPNADLTMHLDRPPVGDWIGVEGTPAWHGTGTGLSSALLRDTSGPFGRVAQSIVLVTRGA